MNNEQLLGTISNLPNHLQECEDVLSVVRKVVGGVLELTKPEIELFLTLGRNEKTVVAGQPGKWIFDGGDCMMAGPGTIKKMGHEYIK